ncbi:DUF305 domain-containing protein [Actinomadura formosensis]|uniref:DUF305 domain-containing protein n=1 Tax=Actinomadura formosensis TaxID=60706 RepID=UPI0008316A3C|nr:DUF305 domain-containing protein [Actinomadura formosensis]
MKRVLALVAVPALAIALAACGDGMMSEKEMKELEDADGRAFDKAFLEMMIEHHEGAVAMGRTEQASGQSPEAKQMADGIISSQSAEIAKMRDMLKKM